MNKVLKICLALLSGLSALAASGSISPSSASPLLWQLDQYSDNLGDCITYISHDGVKVVCKKLKCEVLTSAPDWKVHCYRTDEKIEWVNDLANFGGDYMSNPFARGRKLKEFKFVEQGTGNIKGLVYTKYKTKKSANDMLYTANDIAVAPQVSEFLARLYVTPPSAKIPIYRCLDHGKGKKLEEAKIGTINVGVNADLRTGIVDKLTTKSWKKVAFTNTIFKAPSGYKRTKELFQATYSENKKGEFSEMFDEIGYKSNSSALKNENKNK